jgi:hypothetical protein
MRQKFADKQLYNLKALRGIIIYPRSPLLRKKGRGGRGGWSMGRGGLKYPVMEIAGNGNGR